jgi:hypothetical protein
VVARQREELKGLEYAVLAIVLSIGPFFISMFMLYGDQANVKPDPLYNLKTLGKALIDYAEDNDGLLPDANRWCDLLTKHNRKIKRDNFIRPEAAKYDLRGDCHFAFNENLSGLPLAEIPDDVVLLFMSEGRWNQHGSEELLSRAPLGRTTVPGVTRYVMLKDGTIEMYVHKRDNLWKIGESGLLEEQP